MTSLDTATRLARFMFQEFWLEPGQTISDINDGWKKIMVNPYFSTVVTVILCPVCLAYAIAQSVRTASTHSSSIPPYAIGFASFSLSSCFIIVGIYIAIATVTPVWILLQPRDYLSSFLLYAMLFIAFVGVVGAHPNIDHCHRSISSVYTESKNNSNQ